MNHPLRRVSVVVFVLFALMLANLNRLQFFEAKSLSQSDHNGRNLKDAYNVPRGYIMVGRNAIALSKDTGGQLRYQRIYSNANTDAAQEYAPVTGYASQIFGNSGLEYAENSVLNGTSDLLFAKRLSDEITGKQTEGANLVLTVNAAAQDAAWQSIKNNHGDAPAGGAVALDPKTGKILAMVSWPSFDPNPLSSHDGNTVNDAWKANDPANPDGPMSNRALGQGGPWPPGSTMKVIVSAAALSTGQYTPSTEIPAGPEYTPPDGGSPIHNDVASICPQSQVTLKVALQDSCNTGFAQLGVKLGADAVVKQAEAFGLNRTVTIPALGQDDGIRVTQSKTGKPDGAAQTALTSIGQLDAAQTPMQEAMIASAVANNGTEMQPYLVQEIQGSDLTTLRTAHDSTFGQPITSDVASQLREMMDAVVDNGTGTKAQIDGYEVGGKTGTAEHGAAGSEHGWFMGYARDKNGGDPKVAVGVFLQGAGENGSSDATRIGGDIMKAVLGAQ